MIKNKEELKKLFKEALIRRNGPEYTSRGKALSMDIPYSSLAILIDDWVVFPKETKEFEVGDCVRLKYHKELNSPNMVILAIHSSVEIRCLVYANEDYREYYFNKNDLEYVE